jgi:hypothetical protein
MSSAAGDEAAGRSMQVDGEDDHRAYIFEFFRSHNAYDLLPESGKVLLLDSSVSAYSAFCILSANEQDAAPVWDARTEKYMGMVTLTDMLELVNICQNSKVFTSCLEGMKEMTLDNWMTSYPRPPGCPDISVEAHPDDDLMVVLKTLVRNDCRGKLLSTHPASLDPPVSPPTPTADAARRRPCGQSIAFHRHYLLPQFPFTALSFWAMQAYEATSHVFLVANSEHAVPVDQQQISPALIDFPVPDFPLVLLQCSQ